ncbi:hypothetical protein BpHYR1_044510 [Brachionus plicatilis]|uniref:JmjC domain-containing protein n=1 Tax=Brachionus plicatilis TaxID=10195 RepID=A0A3M7SZ41_BRAPC|nr:hypothetical protein BpHYR1_044510 [Brachionus plicatilis]
MNKIIIFIALFLFIKSNEDPVSNLIENGEIVKIRGYYESPDTDVFLKNDPYLSRPAKFIDYAESLKIVYDDWNILELKKNTALSVSYGNLTQFIKSDKIQTETNLYKFLSHIDEYASPTITKFDMPIFIREELSLPSILECDYLKNRFVEVQMNFYMNFETYSPFETSESDQLVCMLKGNFSSVLLRPEEYEKFLLNQNSKDDLKNVKHSIGEIEKGQCFYVPSKSYYTIKTSEAWFYSISWIPVTEAVNQTDCFLSNREAKKTKLSDLAYKKDFGRANRETKTGFVSYFLFYLDSDQITGINKENFIEKMQQ